jgi:hypothetical protein
MQLSDISWRNKPKITALLWSSYDRTQVNGEVLKNKGDRRAYGKSAGARI